MFQNVLTANTSFIQKRMCFRLQNAKKIFTTVQIQKGLNMSLLILQEVRINYVARMDLSTNLTKYRFTKEHLFLIFYFYFQQTTSHCNSWKMPFVLRKQCNLNYRKRILGCMHQREHQFHRNCFSHRQFVNHVIQVDC